MKVKKTSAGEEGASAESHNSPYAVAIIESNPDLARPVFDDGSQDTAAAARGRVRWGGRGGWGGRHWGLCVCERVRIRGVGKESGRPRPTARPATLLSPLFLFPAPHPMAPTMRRVASPVTPSSPTRPTSQAKDGGKRRCVWRVGKRGEGPTA